MSSYSNLMRRADTLRRSEHDPICLEWWSGYIKGLRRAHLGNSFGSQAEHEILVDAAQSNDSARAAFGHGYISGLKLEPSEPK